MRRVWIALMVIAVAIALALPAAAGKPDGPPGLDKPPPEVTQYEVTMGFVDGHDGFATSTKCTDGGSMTMELDRSSLWPVDDPGPLLDVRISNVNWYRYYPYYADPGDLPMDFDPNDYPLATPLTGTELTGCHGAGIDVTIKWVDGEKVVDSDRPISRYDGLMRLTPHDGSIEFLWHSDYYREWENVGKKKPRYIATDMEDFTYSAEFAWNDDNGNPVTWDPAVGASGVASGKVRISYFRPGGYTPFNEGGFPVKFTLTITPHQSISNG